MFAALPRFLEDLHRLDRGQRDRFEDVVRRHFAPDLLAGHFRPSLRVRSVQGAPGVYEMTWAPDGRATWQYGVPGRSGQPHVIWRRIGTHTMLNTGRS